MQYLLTTTTHIGNLSSHTFAAKLLMIQNMYRIIIIPASYFEATRFDSRSNSSKVKYTLKQGSPIFFGEGPLRLMVYLAS